MFSNVDSFWQIGNIRPTVLQMFFLESCLGKTGPNSFSLAAENFQNELAYVDPYEAVMAFAFRLNNHAYTSSYSRLFDQSDRLYNLWVTDPSIWRRRWSVCRCQVNLAPLYLSATKIQKQGLFRFCGRSSSLARLCSLSSRTGFIRVDVERKRLCFVSK